MASPEDEFARIVEETQRLLGAVRLDLADLEDGRPKPQAPEAWAKESLAIAAPPAARMPAEAPPVPLPPVEPPRIETPRIEAPRVEPSRSPAPSRVRAEAVKPVIERVASIDVERPRPSLTRDYTPPRPSAPVPSAAAWGIRLPRVPAVLLAAAGAAAVLWIVFSGRAFTVEIPDAVDAAASWGGGGIAAAVGSSVKFFDRRGRPSGSLALDGPLTSLASDDGALYAVDGRAKQVLRWSGLNAKPDTYPLDHAPSAVFVRAPHLWTVDASGASLRQYLMTSSMHGLFLQPLDLIRLPDIKTRGLVVEENGSVVTIEAATGRLLLLSPVRDVLMLDDSDNSLPAHSKATAQLVGSDGPLRLALRGADGASTRVLSYSGPLDKSER